MLLSLAKDLGPLRAAALARVDADAEGCRHLWITPGDGMAMVYQLKAAEAAAFLGGGAGPFPFLEAEVEAGAAPDLAAAAATIEALSDAWVAAGAAIEVLRRGAKLAVIAATNPGEISAAAAVDWPKP